MNTVKTLYITSILVLITSHGFAQQVYTNADKVANNGYDMVNYFTNLSALRGSKDFSLEHNGAIYYFTNTKHLQQFKENPKKYLPQFNGYCSFAVAKMNKKVPVNPTTFRIDDGKLYLFYNDFMEGKPFNTLVPWLENENELEKMAYKNWETLKNN